jgi:Fic family protein
MRHFYSANKTAELLQLMREIDRQQAVIDERRPLQSERWQAVMEKLKMEWTYDSNAIEGSTLTLGETIFFLREGLTVEGKPLKDFLDARNHADAIDFSYEVITNKRQITVGLFKELNALLLKGIDYIEAVDQNGRKVQKKTTPGEFKKTPNTVIQLDGSIHSFTDPLQVPGKMEELAKWINDALVSEHGLIAGAVAHYNLARIHPFDDGNGRGARLLMNLILIKKGLPPAVVRNEKRRKYLESLAEADKGDLLPFILFVGAELINTQKVILENLA